MIASINIPFENCDTDSQTVDATGAAASAIFTNLGITKQRAIMLQNRGAVDVLVGTSLAAARWRILPGAVLVIYPRDLAKVFLKAASSSATVDIFQAI